MSSSTANRLKEGARSVGQKVEATASEAVNNPVQAKKDFLHAPATRVALPFINGGLAGMFATACIQPIDMVKVRLQLAGEGARTGPKPSALGVTKDIIAQGKIMDLYTGISAGLLRQAVYTTARLGFFDTFQNLLQANAEKNDTSVTFLQRSAAGLTAGGLAAMVGNPADLALIRMQSDGLKPKDQRANYRSVFDALKRIAGAEGVAALWSGATPTVIRAMALNFGQLTFFAESKQYLRTSYPQLSESSQRFGASAIAGFFASFFSLPFDFIKTRLQKQQKGPDGKLPYAGFADCAKKVVRDEGLLRFYRGFGTYYIRIAPHAVKSINKTHEVEMAQCISSTAVTAIASLANQEPSIGKNSRNRHGILRRASDPTARSQECMADRRECVVYETDSSGFIDTQIYGETEMGQATNNETEATMLGVRID